MTCFALQMFVSGWRRCGSEFDDKQEQSASQAARERSCSPRQKHTTGERKVVKKAIRMREDLWKISLLNWTECAMK